MTVASNCLLYAGERVVITNQTRGTVECSLLELSDHEHVGWHIVLAPETVPMRGNETEARVISRVTNHHYSATAEIFATRQTLAHERRADALVLLIRNDSHWGKPQHVQACVLDQGHSRKENVPDNESFDLRDKRNTMTPSAAQVFYEISLGGCLERSLVHRTNSHAVSFGFWTNTHTSQTVYDAAVERPRDHVSSAARVHNGMTMALPTKLPTEGQKSTA